MFSRICESLRLALGGKIVFQNTNLKFCDRGEDEGDERILLTRGSEDRK